MSGDRYLNNLTPLRGIAALWVAAFHFDAVGIRVFPDQRALLLKKGYLMVDFFFIMSGFIIRHVYWDQFKDGVTRRGLWQFIVARFARIYPLHFFTLVFLVMIAFVSNQWTGVNDASAIPIHLLLLQSFGIINHHTWNVPSWSLSAEWAAYMVFPILVVLLSRKRGGGMVMLMAFIVVAYLAIVFWLPARDVDRILEGGVNNLDVTFDYGFLRGLAGFVAGMLIYSLYGRAGIRNFFAKDWVGLSVVVIGLLLTCGDRSDLFLIPVFWGVALCFASNRGYIHRICSNNVLQFIGKVSYSVYLLQRIVLIYFLALIPTNGRGAIPLYQSGGFLGGYLVFLVGVAAFTYYAIESPCRYYINRKFRVMAS